MRSAHIHTDQLEFRPASVDDAAAITSLMTERISKWVAAWPFPLSLDQAQSILKAIEADAAAGNAYPFMVSERETGKVIGWLKIAASDLEGCWEIGYWIGEAFQGRGFAKDVTRFALSYCFENLKAGRVIAGAQTTNTVSLSLLERMGLRHSHNQMVFAPARQRLEECEYRVMESRDWLNPELSRNS